jgi:hypothetical protein
MGLLGRLLTAPLAPVQGVVWLAEQLEREAQRQLDDPAAAREALRQLELALERGDIDEETFEQHEEALLRAAARAPGDPPIGE